MIKGWRSIKMLDFKGGDDYAPPPWDKLFWKYPGTIRVKKMKISEWNFLTFLSMLKFWLKNIDPSTRGGRKKRNEVIDKWVGEPILQNKGFEEHKNMIISNIWVQYHCWVSYFDFLTQVEQSIKFSKSVCYKITLLTI